MPICRIVSKAAEMKWAYHLETYVKWLATQYDGSEFHLIAHHFDLAGYRTQLYDAVKTGRLSESEASRNYLIAALGRARKLSQVIADNNVGAAKIRHLHAKFKAREAGTEIEIPEIDENEVRLFSLENQPAKWQELCADDSVPLKHRLF